MGRPTAWTHPSAGRPPTKLERRLRLHGWRDPAILATGALAAAAGFAQFGATSALADVARSFGEPSPTGSSVAAEVGLSVTILGIGLGIIRLAALGSLPLAAVADRVGRRRVMLGCTALGLAVTAVAALSPGYWWFVALFALGRPLLAGTNAISGVIAAEETRSRDRAKAIAVVTAAWGGGTGLIAVVRGVAGTALSWRALFGLVLIPLAAMPLLSRRLKEPDRFERIRGAASGALCRLLGRAQPPCDGGSGWSACSSPNARPGDRPHQRIAVRLLRERARAPEAGDRRDGNGRRHPRPRRAGRRKVGGRPPGPEGCELLWLMSPDIIERMC
jgi:MFS family permease